MSAEDSSCPVARTVLITRWKKLDVEEKLRQLRCIYTHIQCKIFMVIEEVIRLLFVERRN